MAAPSAAALQALALYRRGLALSRQLADPCLRHYAFGRITHGFRREAHETSVTRVRSLLHDARKSVRRLARAVAGEPADVRHLLELAYGKRGRMMHVLARARQLEQQGRGPLLALPAATPAGNAAPAAGSSAALLPLLERRVPPQWWPGRAQPGGALTAACAPPPAQHAPRWEETHCVLLARSFLPALAANAAQMPRGPRRLREAVFELPPPTLQLHAPPAAEEGQPPPLATLTWLGVVVGRTPPPPPREQVRKKRPEPRAEPKRWGDAPPRPLLTEPQQERAGGRQQHPRRHLAADEADRATG